MQKIEEDVKSVVHNMIFPDIKEAKHEMLTDTTKFFQKKWDGGACLTIIDTEPILFGRNLLKNGEQMNFTHRFPEITTALKATRIPQDTQFYGELIVLNPTTGNESFQLLQPRLTRDEDIATFATSNPAHLIIYDCIRFAGEDLTNFAYQVRLNIILKHFIDKGFPEPIDIIENLSNGTEVWKQVIDENLEGVIIRDPLAPFNSGVWRLKQTTTQDVFCKSEYEAPKPSIKKGHDTPTPSRLQLMPYANGIGVFANLRCYQIINNTETFIGNIGGGFTDSDRQTIQCMLDAKEIFTIEIEALGTTNSGKFRQPRFKRLRPDKPPAQCIRKT